MNSIRTRLIFGALANSLGKVWVILVQLISIPVLTAKWGATGYGLWLMLMTVPTYLALSDFGFGTAAAADMTRKIGVGDYSGALEAFQSVWVLLSIVSSALGSVALLLWLFRGDIEGILGIAGSRQDIATAAVILVFYSIIAVQMSMLNTGYRSTQRYALGTLLFDALVPIEGLALVGVVLANKGYVAAALCILSVRCIGAVIYYHLLRRFAPWVKIGWSHSSLKTVKALAAPAIASLGVNFSSALGLQGVIVMLGLVASPATAGIFGAARTLTRVPLQVAGLAVRASVPELTLAHARNDLKLSMRLVAVNIAITAAIIMLSGIVLVSFGSAAVASLSHKRLQASVGLISGLMLASAFQAGWATVGQFLFAVNKQQKFAHYYFLFAIITFFSPLFTGSIHVLEKVAFVSAAAELGMFIMTTRVWWQQENVSQTELRHAIAQLPRSFPKRAQLFRLFQ